jgi:hypothetical protein
VSHYNYNGWDALASCSWSLALLGVACALAYLVYRATK